MATFLLSPNTSSNPTSYQQHNTKFPHVFPTPIASASQACTNPHSSEISASMKHIMDSSVSAETRHRKLQYVGEFLDWAKNEGFGQHNVLLPSEAILCNYAASFSGRMAGSTVTLRFQLSKLG
ncbi:hypothetical protein BT96DRAFT_987862 [Gymnopus androsaceus JB14]|uniref:Uncharacterized protein n=1 Tax=Gymnopus androsaceus JB14 TaxID=1447944 RepID=A0A6A4IBR6_9AGAR|nr:hypothetical protein BT96DRAFT_987862 [Gymnopus androsaceus JB14]